MFHGEFLVFLLETSIRDKLIVKLFELRILFYSIL